MSRRSLRNRSQPPPQSADGILAALQPISVSIEAMANKTVVKQFIQKYDSNNSINVSNKSREQLNEIAKKIKEAENKKRKDMLAYYQGNGNGTITDENKNDNENSNSNVVGGGNQTTPPPGSTTDTTTTTRAHTRDEMKRMEEELEAILNGEQRRRRRNGNQLV